MREDEPPPILRDKDHQAPSAFRPEALLREARRQKGLVAAEVPELCLLDPDGDIVRHLWGIGAARPVAAWSCYHSEMFGFDIGGRHVGIVGCAVGAPYAVLLAEQMFVSGCRLLVSITSSGELVTLGPRPYFVLLDAALRDEGASYHYLPPGDFATADARLLEAVGRAVATAGPIVHRGRSWTTDAPYRETEALLRRGRELGLAAIEMESAALYALAEARALPIVCLAHVTNAMAANTGDFEKGEASGAIEALRLIESIALAFDEILDVKP